MHSAFYMCIEKMYYETENTSKHEENLYDNYDVTNMFSLYKL